MASLQYLSSLFERVVASEHSSFYSNFYGNLSAPKTQEAWESLPLLKKSDIASVPFEQRVFVDLSQVDLVRLTSGTTSSSALAIPRVSLPYTDAERLLMPVDSYMGFLLPHRVYDNYAKPGTRFVGGDPARLKESAKQAAEMCIEGIGALPSTLIAFAEPLSCVYDIHRIRHLCLNGDLSTTLQRQVLQRLYPGVKTIVSSYGSSETQGLCAISDPDAGDIGVLLGHPLVHYEMVDEKGAVLDSDTVEGELVVSLLYERCAFPLVRYRTGDQVRMIRRSDSQCVFTVLGRSVSERIRFSHGTILLAELERAILKASEGAVVDFEAQVGETLVGAIPMLELSLKLVVPPLYASTIDSGIAAFIETHLHVSENHTYADIRKLGVCAPLTCEIVGLDYFDGRKPRRLTDTRTK